MARDGRRKAGRYAFRAFNAAVPSKWVPAEGEERKLAPRLVDYFKISADDFGFHDGRAVRQDPRLPGKAVGGMGRGREGARGFASPPLRSQTFA